MIPNYRVWIKKDKKYYLVLGYVKDDGYGTQILISKAELEYEWIDLDDNILESSTGEPDRNGKEIFDGDRCSADADVPEGMERTKFYMSVIFVNGGFCFKLEQDGSLYPIDVIKDIEVIGHIHEEKP